MFEIITRHSTAQSQSAPSPGTALRALLRRYRDELRAAPYSREAAEQLHHVDSLLIEPPQVGLGFEQETVR